MSDSDPNVGGAFTASLRGAETRRGGHPPIDQSGQNVGPYRLLTILGEGGFGTVWLAERREPFVQRVALKIIKPGMDSKAIVARFEQERQALAVMEHPNIARVLDGGVTATGRSYFVMEHVSGEPITTYCDRQRLTIPQRMELFIPICEAVQHAHTKGVIHRDLKPSNILVTVSEDRPIPKVIDFGVAKALSQTFTDKTIITEQGMLIGTPEYMSPEQAEMGATDIDTRTDVYALGVILYELITGLLPLDSRTLRSGGFDEIRRIIREVDPPRPSTRITSADAVVQAPKAASESASPSVTLATSLAQRRRTTPHELTRQLRSELDWIPLKALRKDRTERYGSPADMVRDLRNYLEGRPLEAGPVSAAYKFKKFVARNKLSVLAAGLVAAALVLGLIGTSVGFSRARQERDVARRATEEQSRLRARADVEREKAQKIAEFMQRTLMGVGPSVARGRDTALLREMMEGAARRIDQGELRDNPEAEVRLRRTIGTVYSDIALFDAADAMLTKALDVARRTWSVDHDEVAECLSQLALLRIDHQKRTSEGTALFRESLEMYKRLHPGDHPDTATLMDNFAGAIDAPGHEEEAEHLHRDALAMRKRLFKGDHADIAMTLNNLAYAREARGDARDAEALHREALAMRRRLYPGDHPDIATSLNNLAYTLEKQKRGKEAEALHRESLVMRRRLFKEDHPDVVHSLNNLACLLALDGDTEHLREAVGLSREAAEMGRRLYPRDEAARRSFDDNYAGISARAKEMGVAVQAATGKVED